MRASMGHRSTSSRRASIEPKIRLERRPQRFLKVLGPEVEEARTINIGHEEMGPGGQLQAYPKTAEEGYRSIKQRHCPSPDFERVELRVSHGKKVRIIPIPYENYLGAFLGEQFQLGRRIRQGSHSNPWRYPLEDAHVGEKSYSDTYEIITLDHPVRHLEAKVYTIAGVPQRHYHACKRSMKRLAGRALCEIDQNGRKYFVFEPDVEPPSQQQQGLRVGCSRPRQVSAQNLFLGLRNNISDPGGTENENPRNDTAAPLSSFGQNSQSERVPEENAHNNQAKSGKQRRRRKTKRKSKMNPHYTQEELEALAQKGLADAAKLSLYDLLICESPQKNYFVSTTRER
jgi:hypothetical protein